MERRRKSRPRPLAFSVRRHVSAIASAACVWSGCRRAGPPTKSGARAGGRRLSDRRLHRCVPARAHPQRLPTAVADLPGAKSCIHLCEEPFIYCLAEVSSSFVDSSTYGSKMPRASWNFIGNCILPIAPPDEQRAITDFLDRETAKIDTLVAKKRTLIERLKEKRTALISRTVTRGLTPDAARQAGLDPQPKLKPAGTKWIREVPVRWEVLPFTKYVSDKSDYRGKTPEKTQEGVFLVTAKNVRMGFIDYESSQEYVAEEEYDEIMRRGRPKRGDILFTTEAPLGNIALIDREDIALAQRIIRFRMNPDYFCSRFPLYGMMSDHFQAQLQSLSTGSTAEGLKASKLPILRILVPPARSPGRSLR